jgi:hypothetical protein
MIQATSPGSRSNRKSTQVVLKHLACFYLEPVAETKKVIIGPIRLTYNSQEFTARISGNLVLTIKKNDNIIITNGGYLDGKGNPTAATRELINGIMDTLEAQKLAPYVRAYIEDGVGKLRIGDTEHLLNKSVSHHLVY